MKERAVVSEMAAVTGLEAVAAAVATRLEQWRWQQRWWAYGVEKWRCLVSFEER